MGAGRGLSLLNEVDVHGLHTGIAAEYTEQVVQRLGVAVQVLAGGQVGTGRVTLGSAHAGVGRVTVSGDGSAWVGTGAVDLGDVGQGWLTVSQGGSWASQSASLGSQVSGSGHLRVDHGGSFSQTLGLAVGALGTGELQVDQGGLVSNGSAVIGQGGLSHGKAVVGGANASRVSTWQNNGHLRVGESGVGELWVSDGGLVQSAQATLGRLSGGSGSAVVGAGTARVAEWASTGLLTVGDQGSGLLQVQSGGLVRSQGAVVGQVLGAIGEVLVSGDASGTERASWVNGGSLQVGAQGQGSMAVRSGGLVSNRGAGIGGANLGSLGEVTVAGLGAQGQFATWQVDGDLAGLGPVTIFSGTHDILCPDARLLAAKLENSGVDVEYHEVPARLHVYPILPTASGRHARTLITAQLADPGS